jgi:hypothetical protein
MQKNSKFILDSDKKEDYKNILNEQKIIMPQFLTHNEFIDMINSEI